MKFIRFALSVAVAGALVLLLLWWSETTPREIAAALGRLEPRTYAAALAIQLAIYPLRALRLRALLPAPHRPSFARLLPVSAAHVLAANVLPAKLGEATLVFYLGRSCRVPALHGLAVLLVSRLADFAALAACLSLACLSLGLGGAYPGLPWLTSLGALLTVPALLLGWAGLRGERVVSLVSALLEWLGLHRTALGARIARFTVGVRVALADVQGVSRTTLALTTAAIWACVFLFYALLARGLGIETLGLGEAVFGAGLAILFSLLPVSAFAGLGVQDVGWVVGFTALGVPGDLATSSGLAAHMVYLFNIGVLGVVGQLVMSRDRGEAPPADPGQDVEVRVAAQHEQHPAQGEHEDVSEAREEERHEAPHADAQGEVEQEREGRHDAQDRAPGDVGEELS